MEINLSRYRFEESKELGLIKRLIAKEEFFKVYLYSKVSINGRLPYELECLFLEGCFNCSDGIEVGFHYVSNILKMKLAPSLEFLFIQSCVEFERNFVTNYNELPDYIKEVD